MGSFYEDNLYFKTILPILMGCSILVFSYLIYRNILKQNNILNHFNNSSYSVISIWILKVNRITLISNTIMSICWLIIKLNTNKDYDSFLNHVSNTGIFFENYMGFVVIILQFYEWFVLHSIISYQKHYSFGEILFIMNNSDKHKVFIQREKHIRKLLWVYLFVFTCLSSWVFNEKEIKNCKNRFSVSYALELIIVASTLVCLGIMLNKLLKTMAKFHREEYEIHRTRLISFVFIEGLIIFYQFNHCVKPAYIYPNNWVEYSPFQKIIYYLQLTGVNLILQTIGLVFIKSSKDPMQGISKLDYLQLVSIN